RSTNLKSAGRRGNLHSVYSWKRRTSRNSSTAAEYRPKFCSIREVICWSRTSDSSRTPVTSFPKLRCLTAGALAERRRLQTGGDLLTCQKRRLYVPRASSSDG